MELIKTLLEYSSNNASENQISERKEIIKRIGASFPRYTISFLHPDEKWGLFA